MAVGVCSTAESMDMPCSVKIPGGLRTPPQLEVATCNFKSSNSRAVIWCINRPGDRWARAVRSQSAAAPSVRTGQLRILEALIQILCAFTVQPCIRIGQLRKETGMV